MSFPRYPEYKDSGVEWLGEVPAHWESTLRALAAVLVRTRDDARDDSYLTAKHLIRWVAMSMSNGEQATSMSFPRCTSSRPNGDVALIEDGRLLVCGSRLTRAERQLFLHSLEP